MGNRRATIRWVVTRILPIFRARKMPGLPPVQVEQTLIAFSTGRASSSIEKAFAQPVHAAQLRSGGPLPAMVEAVTTSELFRALASSGPAPEAP